MTLLPWTFGVDLRLAQPAAEMGHFFAESFERRTGQPLAIVGGDTRLASLVALAAPSRPSLFLDATPERTPWVTRQRHRREGRDRGLADDRHARHAAAGDPRAHFPICAGGAARLRAALPGPLPLLRIGWGMIRPAGRAAVAPAPEPHRQQPHSVM